MSRDSTATPTPVATAATAPTPGASLDLPPTRVVGREDDLAAVTALVDGGVRVLTLTGPGGVGKTRLAAEALERLSPAFETASAVPLASLASVDEALAALVRAIGGAGDSTDPVDKVAAHVGRTRTLLLLDNAEHLLDLAPHVARLVSQCPGLVLLVTSRAPLRVRGEHELPVLPLELPGEDVRSAAELAGSPAGSLLLDRAGLGDATSGGGADVAALVEICRRLAGLPLALELAAAHLRTLGPELLLERLGQVLDSVAVRDLPERQRTMRVSLDWSHDLLGPDEQQLLRVLGVFRGGFELTAVEHVAAELGADRGTVLPALLTLADHSLLTRVPDAPGGPRFSMLEPVAEYARSLLGADRRTHALAVRAHAQHFCALAEEAAPGFESAEQVAWLARITLDEPNILLAIDRGLDAPDPASHRVAVRTTWAMWLFWWLRDQAATGLARAERCLDKELPTALRGRANLTGACMSYASGRHAAARDFWAAALADGEAARDDDVRSKSVAGLGLAALAAADLTAAAAYFTDSIPIAERAPDKGRWLRSLAHVWLGTVRLLQGDREAAESQARLGLDLARERGDRLCIYIALYTLAQAALAAGLRGEAGRHLREGIRLSQQTGDLANLGSFLESLAVVEADQPQRAAALFGAADALLQRRGGTVYSYYVPDAALRMVTEASLKAALGAEAYAAAYSRGHTDPHALLD